jgi:tryptophan synthase alpha chain
MNRRSIAETFAALTAQRRIALMPFVPAGFPDVKSTVAALPALEAAGANLIEIGIPFSDPVADGPTIQHAFNVALRKGLKVADVLAAVAEARPRVSIPLVAMVSYSIVFKVGVKRFCEQARQAGFDGLIIPDLPPPEAQSVCDVIRASGLDTNLLIAPTTRPERRAEIAKLCSGFVYYLSVSGITGARDSLPPDLTDHVRAVRGVTDRPVCVGFGISKREHVAMLENVANGAIIGSAVVRAMEGGSDPQTAAANAGAFLAGVRG